MAAAKRLKDFWLTSTYPPLTVPPRLTQRSPTSLNTRTRSPAGAGSRRVTGWERVTFSIFISKTWPIELAPGSPVLSTGLKVIAAAPLKAPCGISIWAPPWFKTTLEAPGGMVKLSSLPLEGTLISTFDAAWEVVKLNTYACAKLFPAASFTAPAGMATVYLVLYARLVLGFTLRILPSMLVFTATALPAASLTEIAS
ncbi:hypothetical protein MOOTH_23360 [Moorella thermoacetica]|nr:hypothetical protein MOOTH_23360 [Moorella thermoacetica]